MTAMILQVEKTLEKIKKEMRYLINKKRGEKKHYEYRISASKIGNFRNALMELYQIGFEQGVYTAK